MTQRKPERVVELLIDQAWSDFRESRYLSSAATAERAVSAAELLGDFGLHIRALHIKASACRINGEYGAALALYTRILGMAEDPAVTADLAIATARAVAMAYTGWVEAALFAGGVPVRKLLGVLDAAEHRLTAIGHADWRAGIQLTRATIHKHLGQWDQAVAAAQDALAAYRANAPGFTLAAHRFQLAELLRQVGRWREAEPLYQAMLDDSGTSPYNRSRAWRGLAWCAVERSDAAEAVRCGRIAVDIAELSIEGLNGALGALVAAHRAAGDLDAAWQTANRYLDTARQRGSRYWLYYALRSAVDIAIDRADHHTAHIFLNELDQPAAALDTDSTSDKYTRTVTRQRQRLAESEAGPGS